MHEGAGCEGKISILHWMPTDSRSIAVQRL